MGHFLKLLLLAFVFLPFHIHAGEDDFEGPGITEIAAEGFSSETGKPLSSGLVTLSELKKAEFSSNTQFQNDSIKFEGSKTLSVPGNFGFFYWFEFDSHAKAALYHFLVKSGRIRHIIIDKGFLPEKRAFSDPISPKAVYATDESGKIVPIEKYMKKNYSELLTRLERNEELETGRYGWLGQHRRVSDWWNGRKPLQEVNLNPEANDPSIRTHVGDKLFKEPHLIPIPDKEFDSEIGKRFTPATMTLSQLKKTEFIKNAKQIRSVNFADMNTVNIDDHPFRLDSHAKATLFRFLVKSGRIRHVFYDPDDYNIISYKYISDRQARNGDKSSKTLFALDDSGKFVPIEKYMKDNYSELLTRLERNEELETGRYGWLGQHRRVSDWWNGRKPLQEVNLNPEANDPKYRAHE
jgi:hypothetical protein